MENGPGAWINPLGCYPMEFEEVTVDSDAGMICAGYACVGEYRTLRALRAGLVAYSFSVACCATVADGALKIWVERCAG